MLDGLRRGPQARTFARKHADGRGRTVAVATALAILTAASGASAAGFATARFGGEHGTVVTTNPTALYYNPAGLGFSEGFSLMADGSLALRRVTWVHRPAASDPPDPLGGEGANAGRAELFNVFGAPMLGASARFGKLALAVGLFVPFGGRQEWAPNSTFHDDEDDPNDDDDDDNFPLAADGVQRWHSIKGGVTFIYGSVGGAYRFGRLSLGASGNLVAANMASIRARNPAGDTLGHADQEGRTDIEVSGLFASFGLGLMFEAVEGRLWFGASYQAQPGLGPMTLKGRLITTYMGVARPDDVALHQALPDIVRAGARYRVNDKTELRLFGDFTRWSVLRTQCVALVNYPCVVTKSGDDPGTGGIFLNFRRYWRDTVGVRAGASRWLLPKLELFVGAGFETAATPDETLDPELPDSQTLQGALGGRLELSSKWFIGLSYTHLYYLPRDNTGKSRLSDAEVPTRRPDGGGKYSQWVGVFNANVEKVF
jgi:long-chain fatty acid transport protein